MKKLLKFVAVMVVVLVSIISINFKNTNAQTVVCPVGYTCTVPLVITADPAIVAGDTPNAFFVKTGVRSFSVKNNSNLDTYIIKSPFIVYNADYDKADTIGNYGSYIIHASSTRTISVYSGIDRYLSKSDLSVITPQECLAENSCTPVISARLSTSNPSNLTVTTSKDQKDVTFGIFSLRSSNASTTLYSLAFEIRPYVLQRISNIRLTDGVNTYTTTSRVDDPVNNITTVYFSKNLNISMPIDVWKDIKLVADVAAGTNDPYLIAYLNGAMSVISSSNKVSNVSIPSNVPASPIRFVNTGTSTPYIKIKNPNDGEVWQTNTSQLIKWDSNVTDFSYYQISLKNKYSGSVGTLLANNLSKKESSYGFRLTDGIVKGVVSNSGGKTADQIKNDYYIEILAMRPVYLTSTGAFAGYSYDVSGRSNYFTVKNASELSPSPSPIPTSAICYKFNTNLTIGSYGQDVSALQEFLVTNGFKVFEGKDGYFGTTTAKTLALFQQSVGIPNTGFFGPLTRANINNRLCKTTPTDAIKPVPVPIIEFVKEGVSVMATEGSAQFNITYKITAKNGDLYVPASYAKPQIVYTVEKMGVDITQSLLSSKKISHVIVNQTNGQLSQAGNYYIPEGDSRIFTFSAVINKMDYGQYRLKISKLHYNLTDALNADRIHTLATPFLTTYVSAGSVSGGNIATSTPIVITEITSKGNRAKEFYAGDEVNISGSGFNSASYVSWNGVNGSSILPVSYSRSNIIFKAPNVAPGKYAVRVMEKAGNVSSNIVYVTVLSRPTSPSPSTYVAPVSTPKPSVSTTPATVAVPSTTPTPYVSPSPSVYVSPTASPTTSYTTPHISRISPSSGVAGTTVTIEGVNFEGVDAYTIFLRNNSGGEINPDNVVVTSTRITFKVPNTTYGTYSVSLLGDKGDSNTVNFTITAPQTNTSSVLDWFLSFFK